MSDLNALKSFDLTEAEVTLWTFKGTCPAINSHWVEITESVHEELKLIVTDQLGSISESEDYSLLAETNESSVLQLPTEETQYDAIADGIRAPLPNRRTRSIKTLRNAVFYAAKFVYDEQVLVAVRKTNSSWRTKAAVNLAYVFFQENELQLSENQGFQIQKRFDFFVLEEELFISNKKNFESVLSYREAQRTDFLELRSENEFIAAFDNLQPLIDFVGSNAIRLRRISAIRQKGFYADDQFMINLRNRYSDFKLNIIFDSAGKIMPTPDTCEDIITALLDHRLRSGFSANDYNVPNATAV